MDTRARKTNAARGSKSLRAIKVHTRKLKATRTNGSEATHAGGSKAARATDGSSAN